MLRTQGESKEHFPGCGCITEVLVDPKILLCDIKIQLGKGWAQGSPLLSVPRDPSLLWEPCSSWVSRLAISSPACQQLLID